MRDLPEKQRKKYEKTNEESSLKNAMFTSILFVGGGIVFFWILLFITYTTRG